MPADGKRIIKRRDDLKNRRSSHEARWELHAPYMSPWSFGVTNKETNGQPTQTQVYDNTAIFANDILANFICGEIINPAEKYLTFRHGDNDLNELDEVKEWAQECTDRVLAAVSRSNFYTEAPTMIAGVTGFGTGSLFKGERLRDVSEREAKPGFRGLRFKCDKIGRFYIAEDPNGDIKTNIREFQYTASQISTRWKNIPDVVRENLANGKLDEQYNIVHAVYPRDGSDRTYGGRGMAYASCYVMDTKEAFLLEEGGFEDFPFTNPRWDVIPGEVYGRCPGDIAFNTIHTLNAAKRLDLESWALDARPPTIVRHDSMLGSVNMVPGSFMAARVPPNMSMQDAFFRLPSGAQHEVNEIREQAARQAIQQAYFVDQIVQMLQVEKTQMTAYEFSKKLELLFRILGPVYGRFQNEFLKPTFDGIFMQLYRAGELPPPPDVIVESGNGQIDIEFQNPLARAQKTTEVESLNFAIADLAPIITMEMQLYGYSEAADWLNRDEAAKMIFDVRGTPAKVVNSDKEVAKIREARKQAQQQQHQQQDMMATAEGLGKAAPALKLLQGNNGGQAAA
jgi:hypothetical protein